MTLEILPFMMGQTDYVFALLAQGDSSGFMGALGTIAKVIRAICFIFGMLAFAASGVQFYKGQNNEGKQALIGGLVLCGIAAFAHGAYTMFGDGGGGDGLPADLSN